MDSGMTPPSKQIRPADSPQSSLSWFARAAAIACASIVVFGGGLYGAYSRTSTPTSRRHISPIYFSPASSRTRAWLEFPAYDLPPLPKYLIGATFRLAQLPMPRPGMAGNGTIIMAISATPLTLWVARMPIIVVGAIGCLAIFASVS